MPLRGLLRSSSKNIFFSKKGSADRVASERGGFLVVFGIILFVLVAFVGLIVDSGVLASSQTRYHNFTDYAALSAMKAYLSSSGVTNIEKLNDAARRASEITGMNISKFQDAGLLTDASKSQDDVQVGSGSTNGGQNGKLIPGRWHQVQTAETPANCIANGEFTPCFEELPTTQLASAFRLELKLHEDSSLKTFFGKLMGQNATPMKGSSTVALIPRHGVFAIDLGRSITRKYHLDYQIPAVPPATGTLPKSEYAFDCSVEGGRFSSLLPIRPAGETSPWKKYQNDYKSTCTIASDGRGYRFDEYTDPEPLTSVLEGIHNSMQFFVDRNIPGDKIGIVGFDSQIEPIRKLEITTPNLTNSGPYKDFFNATKRPTSRAEKTLKQDKFLFPRLQNSAGQPVYTNLKIGLEDAYQQLAADPNFKDVENFVVLVTNGLSNCFTGSTGIVNCADSEQGIKASIAQLKDYLSETYGISNVVLHVIIADPKVGPHSLVRTAGAGKGCLTDGDSRDSTPPLDVTDFKDVDSDGNWKVTPDTWKIDPTSSPARPIFYPNALYSAVQELGGLWGTVRPCCRQNISPASGSPLPGCADFTSELATSCNDTATEPDSTKGDIVTSGAPDISAFFGDKSSWIKMPGVDSKGRLMCDPNNKTEAQQIDEYFRKILDTSPMMLVE